MQGANPPMACTRDVPYTMICYAPSYQRMTPACRFPTCPRSRLLTGLATLAYASAVSSPWDPPEVLHRHIPRGP